MVKGILAAIVAGIFALSGCDDGGPDPAERAGYFKSAANDRVIAYHSEARLTREQVDGMMVKVSYTAGTLSRVVFYSGADNPAPADALTLAGSLQRALQVTAEPPHNDWDWMVLRNPAGEQAVTER